MICFVCVAFVVFAFVVVVFVVFVLFVNKCFVLFVLLLFSFLLLCFALLCFVLASCPVKKSETIMLNSAASAMSAWLSQLAAWRDLRHTSKMARNGDELA